MKNLMTVINSGFLSLASLAIVISYIPQIKQTFRSKSSKGHNVLFWGLLTFSILGFVNNGFVVYWSGGGLGTLIPQLFNLAFAGAMLVMVVVYPER